MTDWPFLSPARLLRSKNWPLSLRSEEFNHFVDKSIDSTASGMRATTREVKMNDDGRVIKKQNGIKGENVPETV